MIAGLVCELLSALQVRTAVCRQGTPLCAFSFDIERHSDSPRSAQDSSMDGLDVIRYLTNIRSRLLMLPYGDQVPRAPPHTFMQNISRMHISSRFPARAHFLQYSPARLCSFLPRGFAEWEDSGTSPQPHNKATILP